ncbi:hypothetical protein ACQJBY_045204 [Aegilops geniculata]
MAACQRLPTLGANMFDGAGVEDKMSWLPYASICAIISSAMSICAQKGLDDPLAAPPDRCQKRRRGGAHPGALGTRPQSASSPLKKGGRIGRRRETGGRSKTDMVCSYASRLQRVARRAVEGDQSHVFL